jgi:hypothetical protein
MPAARGRSSSGSARATGRRRPSRPHGRRRASSSPLVSSPSELLPPAAFPRLLESGKLGFFSLFFFLRSLGFFSLSLSSHFPHVAWACLLLGPVVKDLMTRPTR